jgi:uncharacterized protein YjbJ (UPF0337 family)
MIEPGTANLQVKPQNSIFEPHKVPDKENAMSLGDKASNKAEELKGKGKEAAGRATDDDELQAEGKTDQAKGNLKQAGEKIKDVFK